MFYRAFGPKVVNFASTPETDLTITKSDGRATAVPGETLNDIATVTNVGPSDVSGAIITDNLPPQLLAATYTITVTNDGPSDVAGASIVDAVSDSVNNAAYVRSASGGATGITSGSGSINDLLNFPVGSRVNYTLTGTVSGAASDSLTK